jgi:uncharacterized membrane protein
MKMIKKLMNSFLTWDIPKFWKHAMIGTVLTLLAHIPIKAMPELQSVVAWIVVSCIAGVIELISPKLKAGTNTVGGAIRTLWPSVLAMIICLIFGANNIYMLF